MGWSSRTDWNKTKDAQLREAKAANRKWRWIALAVGMPEKECQERWKVLVREDSGAPPPAPKTATRIAWKAADRDGFLWLLERGKFTQRRATAAFDYQFAYRIEGGVPLRSCLDPDTTGGGSARAFQPPIITTPIEAKRWLFEMRFVVLRGQEDMICVLDAVLGRGMMLRDMAGGDGHRANTLEALLMAALDMVAEHLDPRIRWAC